MKIPPLVALAVATTFILCVAARNPEAAPSDSAISPADSPAPAFQDKKATDKTKPITMQAWDIEEVLAKHRTTKKSYSRFFRVPSTNCGVYTLPKGGKDGQSPHGQDELYYVVNGKAKMHADGKKVDVHPGSLLFIAAGAEHRFVDIEEDLELLVVFSSGALQKSDAQKKVAQKK